MPALVSALKRVDLPTFGKPTMPHLSAMGIVLIGEPMPRNHSSLMPELRTTLPQSATSFFRNVSSCSGLDPTIWYP